MNEEGQVLELKINDSFRNLIPPLSKEEFSGLEQSILAEGCKHVIETWQGYIIDGHHRYEICKKHSLSFESREVLLEDEIAVKQWMIKNQFNRRNMPIHVRLSLALEFEELEKEKANIRMLAGKSVQIHLDPSKPVYEGSGTVKGRALEAVANMAETNHMTAFQYKKIKEAGLEEQVAQGDSIKKVYSKVRKQERQETLKATDFPTGKYRVIYADPPWSYNDKRTSGTGGAEDQYPTMSFEDICKMPVQDITDEKAVLFLWATTPLIREALEVMEAWGFEYKTLYTWDKVRPFFGHYSAVAQEFLLLGTKGSCLPDCDKLPYSIFRIEKGRHSEKPEEFRHIIETLYKYGNKIELFARKKVEDWDVYGNECG